jgi:DNA-binding transcriptional ArsR family regulator
MEDSSTAQRFSAGDLDEMAENSRAASRMLKAISHETRLMILCHLVNGEKTVGQIETLLGERQAAVSQQLAKLRGEFLVKPRREGKTIYYALADERSRRMLEVLHELYCPDAPQDQLVSAPAH